MKKRLKKAGKFLGKLILALFVLSVAWVVLYRFLDPPVTYLMVERYFTHDAPIEKEWKDYEYISEEFALAVVSAEDQCFFEHYGFDMAAIEKAMENNKKGKRVKGASTISQQVAKNVFLWPGRNWLRKGLEAYFTALIELLWSKKRILEVYMNVVELGEGVYGAEAAAQTYFRKPALSLSRAEAALLAAVLPGPLEYSARNPSTYVRSRQGWIMGQMNNLGNVRFLHNALDGTAADEKQKGTKRAGK